MDMRSTLFSPHQLQPCRCLPVVEGEESMKVFNAFPLFCLLLHAFQAKGKVNLSEIIDRKIQGRSYSVHMGPYSLIGYETFKFIFNCTRTEIVF